MCQDNNDDNSFRFNINGEETIVSLKDLCLSNQLNVTVLMSLLVNKGVISQEEYMEELNKFQDFSQDQNA